MNYNTQDVFTETPMEYTGDIKLRDYEDDFFNITCEVLDRFKIKGEGIAEVEFVSVEEITYLNGKTRAMDKPTDVLSYPFLPDLKDGKPRAGKKIKPFCQKNYPFDYDELKEAVVFGSIVISPDIAKEQAVEYGHSLRRELSFLFLHALLHLLGFDHLTDDERKLMRTTEDDILNTLEITREQ